jgi:hypothetical protein
MSNRSSRIIAAATFVAGLAACDSKKETAAPTAAVTPPAGKEAVAEKAADKPADKPVDSAHVLYTTVVKREGSDKPKVEDAKGKQVANWLATLYRGEKLSIVKDDGGDYIQVKTSGEVEGFVKRQGLLIAPDVSEATVLEGTDAFDRPDLLALNSKKKINAGTLIFVVKNREQFSEVNAVGTGMVWVLNGKLTTDKDELAVAKLLAKARSLKDGKDEKKAESITDLINLAKNNFSTTKLVSVMETELNAPAAETPSEHAAGEPAKPQ